MLEVPWKKYSSTIDICEVRTYVLKRKQLNGTTIYEVWRDGDMKFNTTRYFEFLKHAEYIIRNHPGKYW